MPGNRRLGTLVVVANSLRLLGYRIAGDTDANAEITIDETLTAVNNALNGC